MSVNPASDPTGVEYLFTNTDTGNNSGWQDSTSWVDSGLGQATNYNYTAAARDKSPNQNATGNATSSALTGSLEGLIFASGFEFPEYANGEVNHDFVGWDWTNGNNVKSRVSPNQNDLPGGAGNQAAQLEWTNASGTYDTTHGWSTDEIYSLSLNVAPQSWNGTQDRFFEVAVLEDDGTLLWESGDIPIPHYDAFGGNPWPAELFFEYEIDGSLFEAVLGAAEGTPLSVTFNSSGFRGIYFDNVLFTFASSSVAVPEPASIAIWSLFGLGLAGYIYRRRRRKG